MWPPAPQASGRSAAPGRCRAELNTCPEACRLPLFRAKRLAECVRPPPQVDWATAALVSASAMLTTRLGAKAAHRLSERTQKGLFGAGMLLLGPAIAAKPWLQETLQQRDSGAAHTPAAPPGARLRDLPSAGQAAYLLALGSGVGLCSGVLGIGAGSMVVVGLAAGGPADMGHKAVLGTAFAAQVRSRPAGCVLVPGPDSNLQIFRVPASVQLRQPSAGPAARDGRIHALAAGQP